MNNGKEIILKAFLFVCLLLKIQKHWRSGVNFKILISHYFIVRVISAVNYIFFCVSLSSAFGFIKSQTSFMLTFSFSELSSWIYAREALKRHFIMVQGYSALKNLIYALLPVQRGRPVEALKESRAQCEHTECIYSGIDGR